MDDWTRQFYKNEIKEIYKPLEEKKQEKKLLDEIKEDLSFKRIKSGLWNTLKKTLILFGVIIGVTFILMGTLYVVLRYTSN